MLMSKRGRADGRQTIALHAVAHRDGRFSFAGRQARCALGRGGVIAAERKREGDGASPLGVWPILRVLYRPDRGPPPLTQLPASAIREDDGWCDAPEDPAYNRPVRLPYAASCERMWRADEVYDLVCVLGHNDPPRPWLGSAIFMHCATPDYRPTQGCIALARADLEAVLALAGPGARVEIAA
jgi:L,D-peptidoglycan transpeptidase YkuD (ErfK/YbiS/YcfS/YnhG family)